MDLCNGMLRIFSGPTMVEPASHLQIWNASDLDAPILVDEETFGVDGNLYAAVLLEDRAFATTHYPGSQVDPFQAFAIDGAGNATEMSEFIVPEWNDLFHPVLGDTRMLGVGIDDPDGSPERATVSLYDITDLANTSPLVAQAEVLGEGVGNALASASWKYESLTVHENSVNVQAPTGELETGLLLLPFESSWYEDRIRRQHGAQLFTFSSSTITRRGIILHSPFMPRNFHSQVGNVVGNLSYEELTLSDHSDVDQPTALGRVEPMPEYSDIPSYGDHRVRLKDALGSSLWYMPNQLLEVQVISSRAHARGLHHPAARARWRARARPRQRLLRHHQGAGRRARGSASPCGLLPHAHRSVRARAARCSSCDQRARGADRRARGQAAHARCGLGPAVRRDRAGPDPDRRRPRAGAEVPSFPRSIGRQCGVR
jgi:Beta propeller domain